MNLIAIIFFQKQSHRADDYIQQVKPDLQLAITQCIQAAGHEFNPVHQKMLITVSSVCLQSTLNRGPP